MVTPVDVMHLNVERIRIIVIQFISWHCIGQHLRQLTLLGFVVVGAHQFFINRDMNTEAKNIVVIEAKKFANCTVEDDANELADDDGPELQFEDVGGQWDEDADGRLEEKEVIMTAQSEKIYNCNEIKSLLCRDKEIQCTEKVGKSVDAHVNMRDLVAGFLGPAYGHTKLYFYINFLFSRFLRVVFVSNIVLHAII